MKKCFNEILVALKQKLNNARVQKAYSCDLEDLSFTRPNVTISLCSENSLGKSLQFEVDIFVLKSQGMKVAEQVFLDMCNIIEDCGVAIEKISRGTILSDDELGMIMVPCLITVNNEMGIINNVEFTLNGGKHHAEKMEITVSRTKKELYSFGEDIPFDILPQKTSYQINLKGVDVESITDSQNFTFVPEDESGYAYFGCEWIKYSIAKKEITLVSSDRRKIK